VTTINAEDSWFGKLTMRDGALLSLSSLDFARDDPELVEGSKDAASALDVVVDWVMSAP